MFKLLSACVRDSETTISGTLTEAESGSVVLVSFWRGGFAGIDAVLTCRTDGWSIVSHDDITSGMGELLDEDAVREERPSVGPVSICRPRTGCDMNVFIRTSKDRVCRLNGPSISLCLVEDLIPNLLRMLLNTLVA